MTPSFTLGVVGALLFVVTVAGLVTFFRSRRRDRADVLQDGMLAAHQLQLDDSLRSLLDAARRRGITVDPDKLREWRADIAQATKTKQQTAPPVGYTRHPVGSGRRGRSQSPSRPVTLDTPSPQTNDALTDPAAWDRAAMAEILAEASSPGMHVEPAPFHGFGGGESGGGGGGASWDSSPAGDAGSGSDSGGGGDAGGGGGSE